MAARRESRSSLINRLGIEGARQAMRPKGFDTFKGFGKGPGGKKGSPVGQIGVGRFSQTAKKPKGGARRLGPNGAKMKSKFAATTGKVGKTSAVAKPKGGVKRQPGARGGGGGGGGD